MRGILLKDSFYYLVLGAFAPTSNLLATWQDGMSRGTVMLVAYGMFVCVLMALVQNETIERMMNGYRFLESLPVTDREILLAKHTLPPVFILAHLASGFAFVLLLPISAQFTALSSGYLVVAANICLLLCGLVLYFFYRFDLPMTMRFFTFGAPIVFAVLVVIAQIAFLRWARRGLNADDIRALAGLCTPLNLLLVSLAGLALYSLLMRASLRASVRKEY